MNERTNVTDQGYSYGGKDYVYETRTNPVTNVPYQVAIEKSVSKPTMQTTTAQRNADVQTQVKYDELAKQKGITTPSYSATTTGTTTGTGTTEKPTEVKVETKTEEVQPWTINKDDSPEVVASKNATKAIFESQQKMADEANAYFDQLKANAPLENQIVMDQIKAKYNATREKMKQNQANLMGLREKSGYATGGARYTQNQQSGIMANEVNNQLIQLSELDSQEATAIMEASQARKKGDWDALQSKMTILDKVNDNKVTALKNLNDLVVKESKKVEAEIKATDKAKMLGYANIGAYAKGVAPAYAEESLSMNDTQLDAFIKEKATETGIDETVLRSAILEKRTALQKKATGKTSSKKATISNIDFDFKGETIKDPNGFLTPNAVKIMFSQAVANGIKRDDVIDAIKGSIYYGDTKSQMSQYLKSYGFSPDEIQKFVK
jgi:hypothetical protein